MSRQLLSKETFRQVDKTEKKYERILRLAKHDFIFPYIAIQSYFGLCIRLSVTKSIL